MSNKIRDDNGIIVLKMHWGLPMLTGLCDNKNIPYKVGMIK